MASGVQDQEGLFIEIGRGFHGVPADFRMFRAWRWTMLKKVPGDIAS
jgi:hypothetical protein